jgi:hypothetical protein
MPGDRSGAFDSARSFQLVILKQDLSDLGVGYDYDKLFPRWCDGRSKQTLFTIGVGDIETYAWETQGIVLRSEATARLTEALRGEHEPKESVREFIKMKESLGWGSALEHGLYTKGFVALLDGEPLYGGIFLDPTSQLPIDFPVIRASRTADGRAVLHVLPIHFVFLAYDPIAQIKMSLDVAVAPEIAADWRQFPEELKNSFTPQLTCERAGAFRTIIRNGSIRTIMNATGKLKL